MKGDLNQQLQQYPEGRYNSDDIIVVPHATDLNSTVGVEKRMHMTHHEVCRPSEACDGPVNNASHETHALLGSFTELGNKNLAAKGDDDIVVVDVNISVGKQQQRDTVSAPLHSNRPPEEAIVPVDIDSITAPPEGAGCQKTQNIRQQYGPTDRTEMKCHWDGPWGNERRDDDNGEAEEIRVSTTGGHFRRRGIDDSGEFQLGEEVYDMALGVVEMYWHWSLGQ